jgi:hypothetical protein
MRLSSTSVLLVPMPPMPSTPAYRIVLPRTMCESPACESPRATPVLAANVEADATGPFDDVALDDPVMAAGG